MSDWISVKDRLPIESVLDKPNVVLAWFNWGRPNDWHRPHQMAELINGHWRPCGGNGNFDDYVTHWMPLPEPPAKP